MASALPAAPSPAASVRLCHPSGTLCPAVAAARLGVAEVDAAHLAVERERGLAGQRAQHVGQVERRVEGAGGAHQRLILLGAGVGALQRLQAREAGRGLVGERAGDGDLPLGQLAARVEDGDRHVADLAAPANGHEQRGGDVEALDELGPQVGRTRRVEHMERQPGGGHARRAGRALVEHGGVAQREEAVGGQHPRLAAATLADLEQLRLVDLQRQPERSAQLAMQRLHVRGLARGACHALQARSDDLECGGAGGRDGCGCVDRVVNDGPPSGSEGHGVYRRREGAP